MQKGWVAALGIGLAVVAATACNSEKLTAEPVEPSPTATEVVPTPTPSPSPAPGDPVAIITGQTSFNPLATADFSGTSSYSPNGAITAYDWQITARPSGSASQLTTPTGSAVTFFVDLAGSYTLKLTVTDVDNKTGSTTMTFTCVPSQGVHIELTWINQYTHADMDLHLINTTQSPSNAVMFDSTGCGSLSSTIATGLGCDCGYESCAKGSNGVTSPFPEVLDWNAVNVADDNPTLDIDNISISVPENINIIKPAAGTYEVKVHYYSAEGGPSIPVDATVNVYLGGALTWTGLQKFDTINQLLDVGTITVTASGTSTFVAKTLSSTSSSNLTNCQLPAGGGDCS